MKTSCKIVSAFLIFLLNLTVATFASANDSEKNIKAPDPDCPLEYFYLGYDYVMGNPATDGGDPGWRSAFLTVKRNEQCVSCHPAQAFSTIYRVHEMQDGLGYYNRLYPKANTFESFLKTTAFTGSNEFEYQQSEVFDLGLVSIQSEINCQLYFGGRDPNCHLVEFVPNALKAIEEFPISTDDPDWFNKVQAFFAEYGTHFLGLTNFGARWVHESQLTLENYNKLRANSDIRLGAESFANFIRTQGASAAWETPTETKARLQFEPAVEKQRSMVLGEPPSSEFWPWDGVFEDVIPESFELSPISRLLTPDVFPNDPNIELKRKVMEAGYELYCSSVPNCHEPK